MCARTAAEVPASVVAKRQILPARRYTAGRFSPTNLNESPVPLDEADPPAAVPLPPADAPPSGDVALLLHLDDLHPESLPVGAATVTHVGGLLAHAPNASESVRKADREAMTDVPARTQDHFGCTADVAVPGWAGDLPIITAWAPVGPSADALPPNCLRLRRALVELTWPQAKRGYFQVKTAMPSILRATSSL